MAPVDIAAQTRKRDVDQRLPLRLYYRTADNILKQARIYRDEQNSIELYVLLLRFCSLLMETIPNHREYKLKEYKREKEDFRRTLLDVLAEVEKLKPLVKQLNTEEITPVARQSRQLDGASAYWDDSSFSLDVMSLSAPSPMHATDYPSASGPWDLLTGPAPPKSQPITSLSTELSNMTFEIPRARQDTLMRHTFLGQPVEQHRSSRPRVQYPTSFIDDSPIQIPGLDPSWATPTHAIPSPPQPTAAEPVLWPDADIAPVATPATADGQDVAPIVMLNRQPDPPPIEAQVQTLPSQPAPADVADPQPGPASAIDEPAGPKSLHISTRMMEEFMRMVKANTARNLETCGVLAGTLKKGVFNVTTLLLPKQQATSDSCHTENEEEIFEAQDSRGLFQLGWIHTHPSQSCFMSSIDLHTHYSYQIMLQEAVAIVMAPTDSTRKFGIFRLSDPGGVKVIQSCQKRGFHPHESPPGGGVIYEHCAHVFLNPNLAFDTIDLRSK